MMMKLDYLNRLSKSIGRKLTDSEVFGFSQVNSEHCRHKIFNGTFIIDGEEKEQHSFSDDQGNNKRQIPIKLFQHIKIIVHLFRDRLLNSLPL